MTSPGDGGGLGDLLAQMQSLQGQLAAAQADAGEQEVEGTAGGGAVRVRVTGELAFRAVVIDPAVVDTEDVGLLEDLVLAALHDAMGKVEAVRQQAMGSAVSGMLGGLFGAHPEEAEELGPDEAGGEDGGPDAGGPGLGPGARPA